MATAEQRVVAELGRPETPEETAARKAETSRKHRANQTLRNLIWSLVATLIVVLLLVLVVVRPDPVVLDPIDYATVATQAQEDSNAPLVSPVLPPGWSANAAELRKEGDVTVWYIGFVTPKNQFIAVSQGIDANPTWVDNTLEGASSTGSTSIENLDWAVYDHRGTKDAGNLEYALVDASEQTGPGASTIVLYGTADDSEFETLASAIAATMGTTE